MELLVYAKEILQNVAEHVASYRLGQSALRHLDRALWVVEKCARWAVPPPLDLDDRPQPELVRPLPWVFFLLLLIVLRLTRESISIINLFMGKPPLRSADVVMYIQSKRRYLRTLKYQGNRMMRARTSTGSPQSWQSRLQGLLDLAMCYRGSYGNNNTMRHSNNDEVLIVKRSKRVRDSESPVATTSESTMDRLIERMMVDLDADSDDSSFTLTNVTSVRSDRSDFAESDQETVMSNENNTLKQEIADQDSKENTVQKLESQKETENADTEKQQTVAEVPTSKEKPFSVEDAALQPPTENLLASPKEESQALLSYEKNSHIESSPNKKSKFANGKIGNSNNINKELNNGRTETETATENKPSERLM